MRAIVKDVMSPRVIAVRESAGFKEIVWALRRYRVSACPVIDDEDRVIGVVSEADLLFKEADPDLPTGLVRLSWRLAEQTKATAATAGQLMTAPAVVIEPDSSVCAAARVMQERQLKRLPVVDEDGKLVGIITRSDVLSVFERPDEEIWDEVVKVVLAEEFALDPNAFDVMVRTGIVTIAGNVEERETALRILARIRHTEGVVTVRDRMSYPVAA